VFRVGVFGVGSPDVVVIPCPYCGTTVMITPPVRDWIDYTTHRPDGTPKITRLWAEVELACQNSECVVESVGWDMEVRKKKRKFHVKFRRRGADKY
jgi:hypothetical protein